MRIQMICMSAATRHIGHKELTSLLVKSRQRNSRLDVTGMLVYHEGAFLHVLEGDERIVDHLYQRILRDDRHTNCAMLLRSYTDHRSFSDWSMGFVNTDHEETKSLPGFFDFFQDDFSRDAFLSDPTISRTMLLMFRNGKFHQTIDETEEILTHA